MQREVDPVPAFGATVNVKEANDEDIFGSTSSMDPIGSLVPKEAKDAEASAKKRARVPQQVLDNKAVS